MTAKKATKQEMTDRLYKHLESTVRNIIAETPDQLDAWLRQVLQLYKMTKKELNAKFASTFAVINEPPLAAYSFPLTKVIPENVVLDEDDITVQVIKVANEAYGDDLVMNYHKIPIEDFGDTLAKFIAAEIGSIADSGDDMHNACVAASIALDRAAEQLESVSSALTSKARELLSPERVEGLPSLGEAVELSLKIDHEGATFEDITRKTSAEAPTERVIEEIPCVQIAAADWLAAPDVKAWVANRKNKVAQLWCGDVFVVFDHGEGPNSPISEPDHAMPEWLWNKIDDVMRKRDMGYAVIRLLNTDTP